MLPSEVTVTRMLVAASMTWLLVRTWPDEVSSMPVPAARAERPPLLAIGSMSTTAGATLPAIARRAGGPDQPWALLRSTSDISHLSRVGPERSGYLIHGDHAGRPT